MKLLINIIYFVITLFMGSGDVSEEIILALKHGKSSELVKFFDEKVSLKIINQEDVLSKSQAESNIKVFFEKHPVKALSGIHVSEANNASRYLTATLETGSARFRVSILIRRNLISQLRIENDNE